MKKIINAQFWVLLAGTLFAWGNFTVELVAWMGKVSNPIGCTAGSGVNPFLTPCFYGAVFFTVAFVLSAIMLGKKQ